MYRTIRAQKQKLRTAIGFQAFFFACFSDKPCRSLEKQDSEVNVDARTSKASACLSNERRRVDKQDSSRRREPAGQAKQCCLSTNEGVDGKQDSEVEHRPAGRAKRVPVFPISHARSLEKQDSVKNG